MDIGLILKGSVDDGGDICCARVDKRDRILIDGMSFERIYIKYYTYKRGVIRRVALDTSSAVEECDVLKDADE